MRAARRCSRIPAAPAAIGAGPSHRIIAADIVNVSLLGVDD